MEFLGRKGSRCLRAAIVQDLYRIIININVCTDLELLESRSTPHISRHSELLGTEGRTLHIILAADGLSSGGYA